MQASTLLARSLVVLCAMSGTTFADVTVSKSNDPNAGYAADLQTLFAGERAALHSAAPMVLRQAAGPDSSVRPRSRGSDAVFDPDWLATLPRASGGEQWACMTQALYFEARGESLKGQFAVAEVILNRVAAPQYPDTVCGVVNQGTGRIGACQFSFTCDGKPEIVTEPAAWERAGKIARLMLDGASRRLTDGATHFHTTAVRPGWSAVFPQTAQIGTHRFYRQPGAAPGFGAEVTARSSKDDRRKASALPGRAGFELGL